MTSVAGILRGGRRLPCLLNACTRCLHKQAIASRLQNRVCHAVPTDEATPAPNETLTEGLTSDLRRFEKLSNLTFGHETKAIDTALKWKHRVMLQSLYGPIAKSLSSFDVPRLLSLLGEYPSLSGLVADVVVGRGVEKVSQSDLCMVCRAVGTSVCKTDSNVDELRGIVLSLFMPAMARVAKEGSLFRPVDIGAMLFGITHVMTCNNSVQLLLTNDVASTLEKCMGGWVTQAKTYDTGDLVQCALVLCRLVPSQRPRVEPLLLHIVNEVARRCELSVIQNEMSFSPSLLVLFLQAAGQVHGGMRYILAGVDVEIVERYVRWPNFVIVFFRHPPLLSLLLSVCIV